MNRTTVSAGFRQAGVNLLGDLRGPAVLAYLFFPVLATAFALSVNNIELDQAAISNGRFAAPGWLAMGLVAGGFMGMASTIMAEKEDGTLLRIKTLPGGMQAYVFGKTVYIAGSTMMSMILTLIPLALFIPEVVSFGPGGWLATFGYTVLGLFATLPIGVVAGALARSMMALTISLGALYVLMVASGLLFPLNDRVPLWFQWVIQILPPYWIGLGMRSAMLPAEAAVLEFGGSFRIAETLIVLGLWVAAGLALAPRALRRMVRGVSGSQVAKARERVLARGY
ncbi:ABC transporter permease [Tessaracoccus sp. OH4464_COT-324]|uniref:ABC transporter permease n=1 Tax=Tessaracoccus sp. OH4464_COT-324 TaxID=2491059 RepID=UPI000F637DAF|nr:ABC transporter permease [Tessaracoccus sp. OH4464_COT-324]RRD45803.1 ABC transporter permease [Tessaracoccus sp. OH4464_COT-324]